VVQKLDDIPIDIEKSAAQLYAEADHWHVNTGDEIIHAKRMSGLFRGLKWKAMLTWLVYFLGPYFRWDGEQAKDYVFVDDVATANALALDHGDNEAYNIGFGRATSVNTIYRQLVNVSGIDIPAEYGPGRMGDVRLFYLDSSKAARELGWRPQISLADGLDRTFAWYQAAYEKARMPSPVLVEAG